MKKMIFSVMVAILILGFGTISFSAEPGLSDKEAKVFIEKLSSGGFAIKLGYLNVLGGLGSLDKKPDLSKGIIDGWFYKIYQAFEKMGVIKITKVKEYAKGDWNDWAVATSGLKERIFIEKTDVGEALAKKGGLPQENGWLIIEDGTLRVDKIVRNEAGRQGVDNYRIIMATYTCEYTPEFKRAMEMTNDPVSEKGKIIILVKFDPFSSAWKSVAGDSADGDKDFSTNYVSNYINSLQWK